MKRMGMGMIGVLWLALAGVAGAQFKMPKKVYRMDALEAAKAEAVAKGRPITFIYTKEQSTCGLCAHASLMAADVLDRKTVVVYAETKVDWDKLPAAAQSALTGAEAGKYIPKTVILDAALKDVLAVVPYARGDEMNKLLKDAIKKLPDAAPRIGAAAARPPVPVVAGIPAAEDREIRTWQALSGATLEAALVQERGGLVTLRKSDGSRLEIQSSRLSAADGAYLQQVRQAQAGAKTN